MTEEGAYLLTKIRSQCKEDGDCLIYQRGQGKIPHVTIDGAKVNIRKLIVEAAGGRVLPGNFFGSVCETPRCIEETHIRQRTRKQHGQHFGAKGIYSGTAKTAKMAATKRAKSKLDDEKVAAIRASDKTAKALSAEYGVAASYITSIKAGLLWKNYSSPWAGLVPVSPRGAREGAQA